MYCFFLYIWKSTVFNNRSDEYTAPRKQVLKQSKACWHEKRKRKNVTEKSCHDNTRKVRCRGHYDYFAFKCIYQNKIMIKDGFIENVISFFH